MPFRFRFHLIPFVATVLIMGLGLALGQWQTRRALEKEAIEAKLSARETAVPALLSSGVISTVDELEFRRVRVKGEFVREWPIYLDNRPHQGAAGFHLLMPFRIEGSDICVLVMRGWIPRNGVDRTRLPPLETPTGPLMIEGVVRRNAGHVMQLGSAAPLQPNTIVQNVELADFSAATRLPLQPFVLEQTSPVADGLTRDWLRPSTGADKHRGYAFQWYGLTMMAGIFFVVTGFRRGTRQAKN